MKKHCFALLLCVFAFSNHSHAQIALNGTAVKHPYAGLQPELISGVSAQHASNKPLLRHVYLVDENILAFTIDEQTVILSNLKPYRAEESDSIIMGSYHMQSKILIRNGKQIGYICGVKNDWFRPFNEISGERLDTAWIMNKENISVSSAEDINFEFDIQPSEIFRKTFSIDRTHTTQYQHYPLRHEIYCVLPHKLQSGKTYSIHFTNSESLPEVVNFNFDDKNLRSEAIHVNLYGFMPGEKKVAYVSTWLGNGGSYSYNRNIAFAIVNIDNGKEVLKGNTFLKQAHNVPEYTIGNKEYNHNLTDVLALDFSDLNSPGNYKIVLDGIGCSFNFEVNDKSMESISRLLMKGFLHQRSGIELGPPYTDYLRPRNMHPADDFTVHKCDVDLFFNPPGADNPVGQKGIFQRIQASIIEDSDVQEAWGGWMDAGDFDQRMNHYTSVRRMMYLYEMNPVFFENYHLNIPESNNKIPDILDEARWSLDLQRRTQGVYEEGGISWWIESIEHPRVGESSWLQSLPTALVPPTPRASLNYAATAAQMSLTIRKYDPELAKEYLQSALAAMQWVETHPDTPDLFGTYPRAVTEALAYLNLYRCTGDKEWHEKFQELLPRTFKNGILMDASKTNIEVFLNYLLIKELKTDKNLNKMCEKAIISVADELVRGTHENTYGVLKDAGKELDRMTTFSWKALPVAAAHWITKEDKYTDALSGTMQFLLGANPMNRCYISGLGDRWFGPYQLDWESNNMAMPAGIPTFGPTKVSETNWGWQSNYGIKDLKRAGLYPPDLINWPHPERCFNQNWMAPTNEFTVASPMGDLLVISAYLAQLNAM